MTISPNFVPRILVIDDEPFNLEFLEMVLRQHGYRVSLANSGKMGMKLAESLQPDLILLDIMMPGETGFECATILRLSPETSEIPIIFLTALDDPKSSLKGFDAGAVDFITKPFEYREVLNRIRLHLRVARNDKLMLHYNALILKDITPEFKEDTTSFDKSSFTFPEEPRESGSYLYETVALPNRSESHLLLNFSSPQLDKEATNIIRAALSLYSGPLYRPSETFRSVGVALLKHRNSKGQDSIRVDGIHMQIDRGTDSMTVVNAGSLPAILIPVDGVTTFIEPQSGALGDLGKGLLPCSSFEMKKGSRLFIYSREMLSSFKSSGEGIKQLKKACELSDASNLKATCQAVGKALLKDTSVPDGILVAIEA
ncbi:response regulator [Maridesulfovibrio frigidus]|uniref:response regulator n=1 Tax=Maridesulfovibrio frigidus TaxID=340956 RepID=UPI0004E1187E|nr:response regulator [Maridesulfovibrio frigidus]